MNTSPRRGPRGRRTANSSTDPAGGSEDRETPEEARADPHETARGIVLRQLTASAKSRRQLEDKLAERDVPEDVSREVLDRFEAVGLVNDREYAAMFVRSRAQSRKLSRSALRRELSRRGIAGELAEGALAQRSDEDESRDAHELVRKKLPASFDPTDPREREKLTRRLVSMLGRKGYSPGVAFGVVTEELAAHGAVQDPDGPEVAGADVWDTP